MEGRLLHQKMQEKEEEKKKNPGECLGEEMSMINVLDWFSCVQFVALASCHDLGPL